MILSNYTIAKNCTDVSDVDMGIVEIRKAIKAGTKTPSWVYQRYEKLCKKREKLTKYWFLDNWWGNKKYFPSISMAKEAASKETGQIVYLRQTDNPDFIMPLKCSGHTPN